MDSQVYQYQGATIEIYWISTGLGYGYMVEKDGLVKYGDGCDGIDHALRKAQKAINEPFRLR